MCFRLNGIWPRKAWKKSSPRRTPLPGGYLMYAFTDLRPDTLHIVEQFALLWGSRLPWDGATRLSWRGDARSYRGRQLSLPGITTGGARRSRRTAGQEVRVKRILSEVGVASENGSSCTTTPCAAMIGAATALFGSSRFPRAGRPFRVTAKAARSGRAMDMPRKSRHVCPGANQRPWGTYETDFSGNVRRCRRASTRA